MNYKQKKMYIKEKDFKDIEFYIQTKNGNEIRISPIDPRIAEIIKGNFLSKIVIKTNDVILKDVFPIMGGSPSCLPIIVFDLKNSDFSNISAFKSYTNLQKIKGLVFLNSNLSNCINLSGLFSYCTNLISIDYIKCDNATNTANMFYNCNKLMSIPNFNTSNVIDMTSMFENCSSIKDISFLDATHSRKLTKVFSGCTELVNVSLKNTGKVVSMAGLFSGCKNLKKAPILDTSSVKDFSDTFSGCCSLETIPNYNYELEIPS